MALGKILKIVGWAAFYIGVVMLVYLFFLLILSDPDLFTRMVCGFGCVVFILLGLILCGVGQLLDWVQDILERSVKQEEAQARFNRYCTWRAAQKKGKR